MQVPDWVREFDAAVTVCDAAGVILEMNDRAARSFAEWGGRALIGSNVLDCHPEPARAKLRQIMHEQRANTYTIERNGRRKLVHQAPWRRGGEYAGFVEIVVALPEGMEHFVRG
jgi:PAS domain S-box-containing protein